MAEDIFEKFKLRREKLGQNLAQASLLRILLLLLLERHDLSGGLDNNKQAGANGEELWEPDTGHGGEAQHQHKL